MNTQSRALQRALDAGPEAPPRARLGDERHASRRGKAARPRVRAQARSGRDEESFGAHGIFRAIMRAAVKGELAVVETRQSTLE